MSAVLNENYPIGTQSETERQKVTKMVMRLFDKWKISTETQLSLLGMKASSRAILSKYRNGERCIPNDIDKLNRVGLLLLIHQCLRSLYPENPDIIYTWVKCKNKQLDNEPPLHLMQTYGLLGLAKVARFLEFEMVK